MKRRNEMRLIRLATVLGVIAMVFAMPVAAQASSYNSVMTANAPLRICANTSSTCNNPSGLSVTNGEHVQMLCWEDSQWYDGTNRWFIVEAPNANMGWVSADMVRYQTTVGHC
jgi:hypothetical protein